MRCNNRVCELLSTKKKGFFSTSTPRRVPGIRGRRLEDEHESGGLVQFLVEGDDAGGGVAGEVVDVRVGGSLENVIV